MCVRGRAKQLLLCAHAFTARGPLPIGTILLGVSWAAPVAFSLTKQQRSRVTLPCLCVLYLMDT